VAGKKILAWRRSVPFNGGAPWSSGGGRYGGGHAAKEDVGGGGELARWLGGAVGWQCPRPPGGIAPRAVDTRNRGGRVIDKWARGHSNGRQRFELGLNANSNEFKQV
jgi:hypothetical protein